MPLWAGPEVARSFCPWLRNNESIWSSKSLLVSASEASVPAEAQFLTRLLLFEAIFTPACSGLRFIF
jgi:hypothetical protein